MLHIKFEGPLRLSSKREKYFLIAAEHSRGSLIARATSHDTPNVVVAILHHKVCYTSQPQCAILSDHARWYTDRTDRKRIVKNGIKRPTVMEYAVLFYCQAECMLSTTK